MRVTDKIHVAQAQVRLVEILERAGWCSRTRAVELISGAKPTRVEVWCGSTEGPFGGKPDDDFCVVTESGGVCDPRRNVGWYSEGEKWIVTTVTIGDAVCVSTFDGWATFWQSRPWVARVSYDGGGARYYTGGTSEGGTSSQPLPSPLPSDYYSKGPHFADWIDNGGFVVELPEPYPTLYWFAGKSYRDRGHKK